MAQAADQREHAVVVLGALLHDVGRLFQNSPIPRFATNGRHPEVSSEFIGGYRGFFGALTDIDTLQTLVRHHHQGNAFQGITPGDVEDPHIRSLAFLINTADRLSERERAEHSSTYVDVAPAPLASVLQRVSNESPTNVMRVRPNPLTSAQDLSYRYFPDTLEQYDQGDIDGYLANLIENWDRAVEDIINNVSFDKVIATTLDFLNRYAWCIAADTEDDIPDVSLFDHLKTTAAIAACLYKYAIAHNELDERHVLERKDVDRFCLVVGDLSGIQDYIFHITDSGAEESKGAARRLRARSLFVQFLTDIVAHQILDRFGLHMPNILMSSGGKFYILLPNLDDLDNLLEEQKQRTSRKLFDDLGGEIALNITWKTFGDSGFSSDKEEGWSSVIRQVNDQLARVKTRKLQNVLVAGNEWNVDSMLLKGFGGNRECTSCSHRPALEDSENQYCEWCEADLSRGRNLPKAQVFAFHANANVDRSGSVLGHSVELYENGADIRGDPYLTQSLNVPPSSYSRPVLTRFIANHVPVDENGALLTFEKIAEKAKGRDMIAFAKADVDNLGSTFAFGLEGAVTISRIATMSRQLDLFFSGWVEHQLQTDYQDCYAVFSGGDDLFLIGPWDVTLHLITQLRIDFARWVGGNPNLTFSAGILIAHPKYPIPRGAHEVEDALEQSKKQSSENGKKNSITVMGHTVTWDEWNKIKARWDKLEQWIEKGNVPHSFAYNLLRYGAMWQQYKRYKNWKENPDPEKDRGSVLGLKFQPLLAYYIDRNLNRARHLVPDLCDWAAALTGPKPFNDEQLLELDNLQLLARLLILGREETANDTRISGGKAVTNGRNRLSGAA